MENIGLPAKIYQTNILQTLSCYN